MSICALSSATERESRFVSSIPFPLPRMRAFSMAGRRQSSLLAAKRIQSQLHSDVDEADRKTSPSVAKKLGPRRRKAPRRADRESDASGAGGAATPEEELAPASRPAKRRKTAASKRNAASGLDQRLFASAGGTTGRAPCELPSRRHAPGYHRPLLLDGRNGTDGRDALLGWFDGVGAARAMPWRKTWVDPVDYSDPAELRRVLEKRAYEVWISEIMLQQTRVAVVVDYWNRWMAKWPTIHDLAAAKEDEVMGAWRGLGYYSRAKRIHDGAKQLVQDIFCRGLLPEDANELEAKVPGVGRYTAGAISSIVFGHPVAMVDGNVLRVLSRQLGILGNVKSDKNVINTLWAAATALAEAVAQDSSESNDETAKPPPSDRPGRWGQALMELGSTICTPKPNCSDCPITSTCRVYLEGQALAAKKRLCSDVEVKSTVPQDIEDLCTLCEPFDAAVEDDTVDQGNTSKEPKSKKPKQASLSSFLFTKDDQTQSKANGEESVSLSSKALDVVVEHARKFPLKVVKKAVREQETLVCAIRRGDGSFLIQRRPEKGKPFLVSIDNIAACDR